jgi:hypothetical protein
LCAATTRVTRYTAVADTLLVLPWITTEWCALGRPFEAVNVPQIAMLTIALIVPRSLALGIAVVLAFVGEGRGAAASPCWCSSSPSSWRSRPTNTRSSPSGGHSIRSSGTSC